MKRPENEVIYAESVRRNKSPVIVQVTATRAGYASAVGGSFRAMYITDDYWYMPAHILHFAVYKSASLEHYEPEYMETIFLEGKSDADAIRYAIKRADTLWEQYTNEVKESAG